MKSIIMRRCIIICLGLLFYNNGVKAQNTREITINEAEKLFLEKNLLLIAEKYNIEKAKAEVIQAKIFNNPDFDASIDIYNPDNRKWFDATKSTGQYTFSVEQLIRLGGKRNKEIALANINLRMSENQFYEVLRALRFSLNSIFYNLYYARHSLQAFETQIKMLEDVEDTYKKLEEKKTISLNELIRIRSLLYNLKSDRLELQNTFNENQSQLQLLLQDNQTTFIPVIDKSAFAFQRIEQFYLPGLVEEALLNRSDLKLSKDSWDYWKKNYTLQKSIAIPDFSIGANYDKRGNFTDNLFCLSLSFDLPLFNRNQGNIRSAKADVEQSEALFKQKQLEVENEVQKAYNDVLATDKVVFSIDRNFEPDLQELLQSITENFKKKNISLLEFTDSYESYLNNIIKINEIQNSRAQAMEALRFAVGTDIDKNR